MNYDKIIDLLVKNNVKYSKNKILKNLTSFKIGGSADLFVNLENLEFLKLILSKITENNIPFFILGNGSNLLVSDSGFRGVVIKLTGEFEKVEIEDNVVKCGAGAQLARICVKTMEAGLTGLEFAFGIPATCGGAVYMNAGAYGGEICSVITESLCLTPNCKIKRFNTEEMKFSYRNSFFSKNSKKNFIILSSTFKLQYGNSAEIREKMYDLSKKRKEKQPIEFPNAGSIFKRPIGHFVGPMIEKCGLKGKTIGGAEVSRKHAGFIINKNNATCSDVLNLIEIIKKNVYNMFDVKLEHEIEILGDLPA